MIITGQKLPWPSTGGAPVTLSVNSVHHFTPHHSVSVAERSTGRCRSGASLRLVGSQKSIDGGARARVMIGCRHDSPPEIRCRHNVARRTRLLGHLRLPSADRQRRLVCRRTCWRHVDLRLVSKVTRWDRHEPMDMAWRDCDSCGDHAGDGTQGKPLASGWVLCKLERHQTLEEESQWCEAECGMPCQRVFPARGSDVFTYR